MLSKDGKSLGDLYSLKNIKYDFQSTKFYDSCL